MKKKIFSALIISNFAVAFMNCNKADKKPSTLEEAKSSVQSYTSASRSGISIINGMLAFSNFNTYEDLVNNPDSAFQADWLAESSTLGFNSLLEHPNTVSGLGEAIRDDYFKSILNEKGCVKISNYYFLINPFDTMAYVLNVGSSDPTTSELQSLYDKDSSLAIITAIKLNNDGISLLKEFESDLADATYSGTLKNYWLNFYNNELVNPHLQAKRCREDGAGARTAGPISYFGQSFVVNYYNGLIFHSLKAFITSGTPGSFRFDVDICFYKLKCGGTVGPYQSMNNGGSWQPSQQKFQSWQGSTNLNKYRLKARAFAPGQTPTAWLEISVN